MKPTVTPITAQAIQLIDLAYSLTPEELAETASLIYAAQDLGQKISDPTAVSLIAKAVEAIAGMAWIAENGTTEKLADLEATIHQTSAEATDLIEAARRLKDIANGQKGQS